MRGGPPPPLRALGGGLLAKRIARILTLAGHPPRLGLPRPGESVGVWGGGGRTAWRGEAVAARWRAPLVRVEDAFLRSLHPGRLGEPPTGLLIDRRGLHFDGGRPSDLEHLLATHPLDDPALLDRARAARARLRRAHLTKYAAVDPDLPVPAPGYVLIVDQVRSDAALPAGADRLFAAMLERARAAHPSAPIVVKTHPETAGGHRWGHLTTADLDDRTSVLDAAVSRWRLLDGAVAVYTISSQLGFEAILAGHRPHVFGQPFYAGWGLTRDAAPPVRRGRPLSADQLFAGAMILYPTWYDPFRDRLCPLEDVIANLEAAARAWRADRHGWVASGMRAWKRPHLRAFFGHTRPLVFRAHPARASAAARRSGRGLLVWANAEHPSHTDPTDTFSADPGLMREAARRSARGLLGWANTARSAHPDSSVSANAFSADPAPASAAARRSARGLPDRAGAEPSDRAAPAPRIARVEDGFLRSRGLGAALTPPLSLVADDLGIYYDPSRPSRLEHLIAASIALGPADLARAERLVATLLRHGLSKYNPAAEPLPPLPAGRRILVTGQVADDASIRLGAGNVRNDAALIARARAARPGAVLIYKPHPDVVAGLRRGTLATDAADITLPHADPAALLAQVDEVWTITSTLGFEALLRGLPVTCLGAPFYAGWGLTRDLGPVPARRRARPPLMGLAHAALIDYPRYRDPATGRPCPPEIVAEHLATGAAPSAGALARLQALRARLRR